MKFTIGHVFGFCFSTIGGAIGPLLAVTAISYIAWPVICGLPLLLLALLPMGQDTSLDLLGIPLLILVYLGGFFHWCAVTEIALLKAAGKPIRMGRILRNGFFNLFPVLCIAVLWYLGFLAGLTLLFIPGIIFSLAFQVVVPAYIAETRGVFAAFKRSRDLTRGHRWGLLGLDLLVNISVYVAFAIVAALGGLSTLLEKGYVSPASSMFFIILAYVALPLLFIALPVMNASIYVALRGEKGELPATSVAAVFE